MIIHSPIISGSLTFAEGATFILPDNGVYSGSFSGSINGIGNPGTFSASIENKISQLNVDTGSQDARLDLLESYTSSQDTKNSTLGTYTSSLETKNSTLGTYTGSVDTKFSTLSTYTGSIDTKFSTLSTYTGSIDTKNNTLGTYTGSVDTKFSTIGSFTQSIDTTIKTKLNVENVLSGSSQVLGGSGLVSSSAQIDVTATTNYSTISSHISNTSNPHSVTATQVGLGNVTNESKATMFSSPTFTGTVSGVTATHVGLGNVTNESKSTMFTSPTFTGTPIAPTAASNTNSTQIATTAYVQQELTDLIGGANEAFDTLLEISASLASGDSTLNTLVNGKLGKSSNLSDLTDTSAARTNLGLVIGTNVQAYNSTLASVAGGTYSGDDSITTIGTVTAGNVTAILPAGTITGSSQVFSNVSGDVTIASNGVATIAANSVALGTDTTGNYVASLVAGTNITLSNNTGEGATPTVGLTNNTISGIALGSNLATLTIGTGLSGTSYNGSSAVTIANTGVTSNVAGGGISVSGATGAVTITNTGVTSNVAGTGVSVSGATGAVTISIGQAVATSSNVQFNSIGIGMAASATAGRIDATNDIVAYSSSDIRFKENITPIENALDKINQIGGYTYDWKEENKIEHGYDGNDVGVIAQEIESVLPQLVQTRESGYKAVKYDKLVALLIQGIKEQQKQIDELKLQSCNCNK